MRLYADLSALAADGPLALLSRMEAQRDVGTYGTDSADAKVSASHGLNSEAQAPAGDAALSLWAAHAVLLELLPPGTINIYEPGGGSVSYLPPSLLSRARVTVIDIDPVQIARNRYADVLVCGDVQRHWLPSASVDLIACYNVLQNLTDVESALVKFSEALRSGGLILIAAPLPYSPASIVARSSPYRFHVWFHRRIRGDENAGAPGHEPFPVHFHPLVAPQRLKRFMAVRGFETVYERLYESPRYAELRAKRPAIASMVNCVFGMLNLSLMGRANLRHGGYHLVLRKGVGSDGSRG